MLRYNGITIGTVTIEQDYGSIKQKFTIDIRQGNCLAVLVHIRKLTPEEIAEAEPGMKYRHTLYTFFSDEQHLKNLLKHEGSVLPGEKVLSIKLNMYYKECNMLLKYFVRSGLKVTAFYKEPKKNKK